MKRRDFLKMSSCGVAAFALGSGIVPVFARASSALAAQHHPISLKMVEVDAEMVDGTLVYSWAFSAPDVGPRIPAPVLIVQEGKTVRLTVTNEIERGGDHGFAVPGVYDSGAIPFGESVEVEFTAPKAGTYYYLDPFNAPVNRVMGLHGALVVMPDTVGNNTPYSDPTPNVQRLFNDLGTKDWSPGRGSDHFPGHPWDPARTWIWLFSTVDPDKNERLATVDFVPASEFTDGYLPRYFTINGKSGYFAAGHSEEGHEHVLGGRLDPQAELSPFGNVGQPALIRSLNAGLATHSPHPHGNHFYLLAKNGTVRENVWWIDTWSISPLERIDLLLPFIVPPEIGTWPPVEELFPLVYPMHCHVEMSQTAAGGNYPQGAVTHWQIDGELDEDDAVIQVDVAELRVRSGQLRLEGRCSKPNVHLGLHPGDGSAPAVTELHVGSDGRWSFQGRALSFLGSRRATLMLHGHGNGHGAAHTFSLRLR